jgi:hypothetical protein
MSARCYSLDAFKRGDLAEQLVPKALELVDLVHGDGDADTIGWFLRGLLREERDALPVILAALVPMDCSAAELLAFITWDEHGQPLGDTPLVLPRRPAPEPDEQAPKLSARERNLLTFAELTAQGLSPEQAAVRMGKDPRTGWRYAQTLREREQAAHRADLERALKEAS